MILVETVYQGAFWKTEQVAGEQTIDLCGVQKIPGIRKESIDPGFFLSVKKFRKFSKV